MAEIIFLPGALEAWTKAREAAGASSSARKRKQSVQVAPIAPLARTNPNPVYAAYDNDPSAALTRVLLLRISINLGLPLEPEDYGILHRYGHLYPRGAH